MFFVSVVMFPTGMRTAKKIGELHQSVAFWVMDHTLWEVSPGGPSCTTSGKTGGGTHNKGGTSHAFKVGAHDRSRLLWLLTI